MLKFTSMDLIFIVILRKAKHNFQTMSFSSYNSYLVQIYGDYRVITETFYGKQIAQ